MVNLSDTRTGGADENSKGSTSTGLLMIALGPVYAVYQVAKQRYEKYSNSFLDTFDTVTVVVGYAAVKRSLTPISKEFTSGFKSCTAFTIYITTTRGLTILRPSMITLVLSR